MLKKTFLFLNIATLILSSCAAQPTSDDLIKDSILNKHNSDNTTLIGAVGFLDKFVPEQPAKLNICFNLIKNVDADNMWRECEATLEIESGTDEELNRKLYAVSTSENQFSIDGFSYTYFDPLDSRKKYTEFFTLIDTQKKPIPDNTELAYFGDFIFVIYKNDNSQKPMITARFKDNFEAYKTQFDAPIKLKDVNIDSGLKKAINLSLNQFNDPSMRMQSGTLSSQKKWIRRTLR